MDLSRGGAARGAGLPVPWRNPRPRRVFFDPARLPSENLRQPAVPAAVDISRPREVRSSRSRRNRPHVALAAGALTQLRGGDA